MLAGVAEALGDRHHGVGRLAPHQRRFVRGRHHHHAAGQTLDAEIVGDELLDLAAALADQADDVHIGLGVAGEHRHQDRLADAGPGEDTHALPAAAG